MPVQGPRIGRGVAGTIVASTLLAIVLVVGMTEGAAEIEFYHTKMADWKPPIMAQEYRSIYLYAWALIPVALVWGVWILRKRTCSLAAVVVYGGVLLNVTLSWLLYTLLVFYTEWLVALDLYVRFLR